MGYPHPDFAQTSYVCCADLDGACLAGHTDRVETSRFAIMGTVAATTVAAPLGGIGIGLALSRLLGTGGLDSLAFALAGMWWGTPLVAITVFAVCLLTVARATPKRGAAMWIMMAGAAISVTVFPLALLITRAAINSEIVIGIAAVATIAVIGVSAYLSLRIASRIAARTASSIESSATSTTTMAVGEHPDPLHD